MLLKPKNLILASGSESRLNLLKSINLYPSLVISPDIDEYRKKNENADIMVARLAKEKCYKVADKYPDSLVIAADTTAVSKGQIMEKTFDEKIVRKYLKLIKGKRHKLYSSFCVAFGNENFFKQKTIMSILQFKNFSEDEIEKYIATKEWQGCAGGYRVEGYIGRYLSYISGSFSNILGLPVYDLHQTLLSANLDLAKFEKK